MLIKAGSSTGIRANKKPMLRYQLIIRQTNQQSIAKHSLSEKYILTLEHTTVSLEISEST